jgi:hypothetical protein
MSRATLPRVPAHLQLATTNGKRPLPIALAALHEIAGWDHPVAVLTHEQRVARAALSELHIDGPVRR